MTTTEPPGGSRPAARAGGGSFSLPAALLDLLAAGAARLPPGGIEPLGRALGWLFGSVIRYHRTDALRALRQAFPDWTDSRARETRARMYAHLGIHASEMLRLAGGEGDAIGHIDVSGWEQLDAALQRRRGALILSAHLGHWELLPMKAADAGYPVTVITKALRHPPADERARALRARYGVRAVPAHHSYRRCLAALRRNELVGFMLDQNMIDREGVFVSFFGRPACTSPGLAYLSAHAQAPVVPAFAETLGGRRYRIQIHPPLDPPADREAQTLLAATQTYTSLIEREIRARPEQWIWIHRRWRTRPPGAPHHEESGTTKQTETEA